MCPSAPSPGRHAAISGGLSDPVRPGLSARVGSRSGDDFRGPLHALFASGGTLGARLAHSLVAPDAALPVPPAADRSACAGLAGLDAHAGPSRANPSAGTGSPAPTARAAAALLAQAGGERASAWPMPLASQAARVHRDGNGEAWESAAFARQARLTRAAVAAALTRAPEWLDEVADGLVLLCEQSSWSWPAHDDCREVGGSILAVPDRPYLDLGAGEVAAQVAWIDHLLGADLDTRWPGLRDRLRREARIRIFLPFRERRDWHWIGLDGDVHNWNPWIHGNIMVAALRLLDDPAVAAERAEVVALTVSGLDRYLAVLPADGAIDEGYGYWWNGAGRALEALEVLAHATGGALDGRELPALIATVAFPRRMHLGGPWYLNVADGQARPAGALPWRGLYAAARRLGDDRSAAHAAAQATAEAAADATIGVGRVLLALTDPDWRTATATAAEPGAARAIRSGGRPVDLARTAGGSEPTAGARERAVESPPARHTPGGLDEGWLERDIWLPSVQVMIARERAGRARGLTLAAKGGHNAEHHNHNDVGSFVVASDGVPVLIDPGRPTYTAATFGPDRYRIWTMQSDWHNVPEVRGTAQVAGPAAAAGVAHRADPDRSDLTLDLAAAYPGTGLMRWTRSAALRRRHGRQGGHPPARIEIDDQWAFDDDADPGAPRAGATILRLVAAGEVSLTRDGARVVPLDGATPVRLRWPAGVTASLVVRDLDDPMLADVWGSRVTRVDLDVSGRRACLVTVEQEPTTREDGP